VAVVEPVAVAVVEPLLGPVVAPLSQVAPPMSLAFRVLGQGGV
jgi:hypothetical protein